MRYGGRGVQLTIVRHRPPLSRNARGFGTFRLSRLLICPLPCVIVCSYPCFARG